MEINKTLRRYNYHILIALQFREHEIFPIPACYESTDHHADAKIKPDINLGGRVCLAKLENCLYKIARSRNRGVDMQPAVFSKTNRLHKLSYAITIGANTQSIHNPDVARALPQVTSK